MLNRFLLCLLLGTTLLSAQEGKAMDVTDSNILYVPEDFPYHTSRRIKGVVKVPDHFDELHYLQTEREAACTFNAMFAGVMHSPWGREQVQAMIRLQDANRVLIRFRFPKCDIIQNHEFTYQYHEKSIQDEIKHTQKSLELWKQPENASNPQASEEIKNSEMYLQKLTTRLERLPTLWKRTLSLHTTDISVPKKFVTKPDAEDSFPLDNPKWLNLYQQAYMIVTKNITIRRLHEGNGYSEEEEIKEDDGFGYVPFCHLFKEGPYKDLPNIPWLNLIHPAAHEPLTLFPVIDREIKKITLFTDQEKGLDLSKITDLKVELGEGGSLKYTEMKYKTVTEFAETHGLTKALLMDSNVIQFGTLGHALTLFFGKGKIHYYDNLREDKPLRKEIYGSIGPIYEEAHFFKGQDLTQMSKDGFLQRVFQEIHFRCGQYARIEEKTYSEYPQTEILFFKKPLRALQ